MLDFQIKRLKLKHQTAQHAGLVLNAQITILQIMHQGPWRKLKQCIF